MMAGPPSSPRLPGRAPGPTPQHLPHRTPASPHPPAVPAFPSPTLSGAHPRRSRGLTAGRFLPARAPHPRQGRGAQGVLGPRVRPLARHLWGLPGTGGETPEQQREGDDGGGELLSVGARGSLPEEAHVPHRLVLQLRPEEGVGLRQDGDQPEEVAAHGGGDQHGDDHPPSRPPRWWRPCLPASAVTWAASAARPRATGPR